MLSWLYYGKSFEALVNMLKKQSDRPEADAMDRQRCALATKQIIDVSIMRGSRPSTEDNPS
ncbi:MAG: DUF6043 family protein [Bacteroidales bacterium]|nr:DUF6043 family protein [Bacteroidales bacterium]